MKTLLILAALSALGGCTSMSASQKAEVTWQVVNAVDFSQTVNIARNPCFNEVAFPTAQLIGHNPSEAKVIGIGVAYGLLHYAVSKWLDRQADGTYDSDWGSFRIGWHVVTLGISGYHVAHNADIGLTPFGGHGPAQPSYETCRPYYH